MDNVDGALAFDATIQNADFKRKVAEMEAKIKGMTGTVAGEGSKMDNTFRNLAAGAAGVFTVQAALAFRQKLIEVRGEFQKYQAVLTNSLGSQKEAAEAMKMLTEFAAKTPFQLDALTSAYIKLVNQGFKPSVEQMRSLGDLASSTGKQFEQLAEAILDAQTGEFERLKEFGVKAAVSGDKITFAFKNVKTTVDNSAEAIRNYILSLGQMQGVKGAMAAISGTLVGQVSNLQDSITSMFNEIGQKSEGFLSKSIEGVAWLVENYEKIGKVLLSLIATYGAYKTAVIAWTVAEKAAALATGELTLKLSAQSKIMALLNKTMLANPWVALATGVLAAISALAIFRDRTSDAQRAQEQFNKSREDMAEQEAKNKALMEELLSVVTDVSRADLDRVIALGQLQKKYPEIFAQYDIETIKLADILKLKRQINEEDNRQAKETGQKELENTMSEVSRLEGLIESYKKRIAAIKPVTDVMGRTEYPGKLDLEINLANFQSQLNTARGKLKMWQKQIQEDRTNETLANLQNYTKEQIQAEYAARQRLIADMQKPFAWKETKVEGGLLPGFFSETDLKQQSAVLEKELEKRNAKVLNYSELEKKYADELIAKENELNDLRKQPVSETETARQKRLEAIRKIEAEILKIKKDQKDWFGKGETTTSAAEKKSFDELINYKKQQYEEYATWLEAYGKESAGKEYAALMAEGESYTGFLQQKIALMEARRDDLSTKELENLHALQVALSQQVAAEKAAADEKAKAQAETEKQITDALLSDYGGYLADKLAFERTYLENKKRLTLAVEKATSDAELQLALAALDNLEKQKKEYAKSSGDLEYDDLLRQYASFEDKKNEISAKYEEQKRDAIEHGNYVLLRKILQSQRDELSKLSLDELMNTDAWKNLFDNLDKLTVDEITNLKAIIEKTMQGMDLTPEELKTVEKYFDDTTEKIQRNNPFKALKESLEKYKETADKEDLKKGLLALGASVGTIGEMFNSITDSIEKMGVEMTDVTKGIMDDIGGILQGLADITIGVLTDPALAVQGALDLLVATIDLIAGTKDRKLLRSMELHQNAVDDLTTAYGHLQDAIDAALGMDVFRLQQEAIANLKEQNVELNRMAKDEQDRKKTDEDKLDDYREQIYQNEQMMNDIQAQMAEQIVQTTAKTATDELVDALVSAWAAGEDAAKAWGDTVEEIMQEAVVNAIKMQIIEKLVNNAIDNLMGYMGHWEGENFVFDGLTPEEQAAWTQQMQGIYEGLQPVWDMLQKMFPEWDAAISGGGMAGAIKGVSEETASLIAGQMNAIRLSQATSLDIMRNQLISLSGIKENTDVLPESLSQLRAIASNTTQSLGLFTGTGIKVRY